MLKESLEKLKNVLAKFESEETPVPVALAEDTLEDGTKIKTEGKFEVGDAVMVVTESGDQPIPDGTYMLVTSGVTIVTLDGSITEVQEVETVANPQEEFNTSIIARFEALDAKISDLNSKLEKAEGKIKDGFNVQKEVIELFETFSAAPVATQLTPKNSLVVEKEDRVLKLSQNLKNLKIK